MRPRGSLGNEDGDASQRSATPISIAQNLGVFGDALWFFKVNFNGVWNPGTDFEGVFGLPSDVPVVGNIQ